MSLEDLKRARAEFCEVIIIIADMQAYYVPHKNRSQDSYAIFVTNLIDTYFPHCRVVLELIEEESLEKINVRAEPSELPYSLWPRYTCGDTYFSTLLDCLTAQSIYKPALVRVIGAL